MTSEEIHLALEKLEAEKTSLLAALDAIKAQTLVRCENNNYGKGCGMGYEVQEVIYVQTHYYVPPSGCTEGDYFVQDEGQWICPNCLHINRLYNKPEVMKLKHLFKDVIDKYD